MLSTSILIRKSDKKPFKVTWLSHWSDIESLNNDVTDTVKWLGDDLYISHSQGHTYELLDEKKHLLAEVVDPQKNVVGYEIIDLT